MNINLRGCRWERRVSLTTRDSCYSVQPAIKETLQTVPTKSLETTCHFPTTFHYNTMSYQVKKLLCIFKHFNLAECFIVMNNYFN